MEKPEPPDANAGDAEGLFAHLFDLSPFPAVVSRLHEPTVLAINLRTSEIFGIPQREAVGRLVSDYYVNPSDRVQVADRIRRDGRVDSFRVQVRDRNGEPFWGLISSRLVNWRSRPMPLKNTAFEGRGVSANV